MVSQYVLHAILLCAAGSDEDTNGLELIPQHTVHPPFLSQYWRIVRGGLENENITSSSVSTSGGIGNWDFGASTIITNDRISLSGGWFRNLNKLQSIFTEGWRVILRLHYVGTPEVPLILTYSTMKGNYPFMWTEMELSKGQRGAAMFQVKTGGLNVTQGKGNFPLPKMPQNNEEGSLEVQFLYNRRTEKLIVNVGEGGVECVRVNAELDDGYHFGLQNSPSQTSNGGRWNLDGFYFTSLPHYAFLNSQSGKPFSETSHYSNGKSKSTDALHEFMRSREDRDKQRYSHHGNEEREQESYMQRIADAQRRRMEMQEKARTQAELRRARPDPYAADEDDDDDDDDTDDSPNAKSSERERLLRKRMFDREMEVTGMDYDGEYDSGGSTGKSPRSRYRRPPQKHQVVNPNNASLRPPTKKRNPNMSIQDTDSFPPVPQPGNALKQGTSTEPTPQSNEPLPTPPTDPALPPPASNPSAFTPTDPPAQSPPQQPGRYMQNDFGETPPPPINPQYGRPSDAQYKQYAYAPPQAYDNRQPLYYGNQYAPGDMQGGYGPNVPPPPRYAPQQQQQYYQQQPPPPPQQQNPYGNGYQQYTFRQPA